VFPWHREVLDILPSKSPFSVKRLRDELSRFLEPVDPGQRVMMAFDDPEGALSQVFDGYRSLIDPLQYVATERGIQYIPDWIFVQERNYEGAPDCWGVDVDSCISNLKEWNADYLVIYTTEGALPGTEWTDRGFIVLSHFDWSDYEAARRGVKMSGEGLPPTWWLLAPPTRVAESVRKNEETAVMP
jgi:hypothetical protein